MRVWGVRWLRDGVDQHGLVDATPSSLYKGHRFPVEIISHCVWLYHRFPLSLRDVQEMMTDRGVSVSYDTIHQWCRKFGHSFANDVPAQPFARKIGFGYDAEATEDAFARVYAFFAQHLG